MAETLAEAIKLIDSMQTDFATFQKTRQTEWEEFTKNGKPHPETIEKIDRIGTRLDELEVALKRLPPPEAKDPNERTPYQRAFIKHLRYTERNGHLFNRMDEDERKAYQEIKSLSVSDDNTVGILVPEDFRAEIIRRLPNISDIQGFVRHESTTRDVMRYPRLTHTTSDPAGLVLGTTDIATSGANVVWEDEMSSTTETDIGFGQVTINMYKVRASERIGRELMEDAAVDPIALLSGLLAERMAVEFDRVITRGAGGKQPEGFLTNGSIPTPIASGSGSNKPTYDGIMDTWSALPAQYAKRASWMMRRATIGDIRKIKDSIGRPLDYPLWAPPTTPDGLSTILGHPVITNEHMPATGVANANAIAFADWSTLYMFVLKTGMSMQRLDEVYAATDEVGFIVRQRAGGKVIGEWAARYNSMT